MKIYIIFYYDDCNIASIERVFDSKSKAEAYMEGAKGNDYMKISEREINKELGEDIYVIMYYDDNDYAYLDKVFKTKMEALDYINGKEDEDECDYMNVYEKKIE
jgi:hypothetical protein